MEGRQRFETVRCRGCGEIYSKPTTGGIASCNPGCPVCGNLGWTPVDVSPCEEPSRSAVGPPLDPFDRRD